MQLFRTPDGTVSPEKKGSEDVESSRKDSCQEVPKQESTDLRCLMLDEIPFTPPTKDEVAEDREPLSSKDTEEEEDDTDGRSGGDVISVDSGLAMIRGAARSGEKRASQGGCCTRYKAPHNCVP